MSRIPQIDPFITDNPAAPAQQSVQGVSANLNAAAQRQNQAAISDAQIRAQAESQKAQIEAQAKGLEARLAQRNNEAELRNEGFENLNEARLQQQREQQEFTAEQREEQFQRQQELRQQDQQLVEDRREFQQELANKREARLLSRAAGDREQTARLAEETAETNAQMALLETARTGTLQQQKMLEENRVRQVAQLQKDVEQVFSVGQELEDELSVNIEQAIAEGMSNFAQNSEGQLSLPDSPVGRAISFVTGRRVQGDNVRRSSDLSEEEQRELQSKGGVGFFKDRMLGDIANEMDRLGMFERVGFEDSNVAKGKFEALTKSLTRRAQVALNPDSSPEEAKAVEEEIAKRGEALLSEPGASEGAVGMLIEKFFEAADLTEGARKRLRENNVLESNGKFQDDEFGNLLQEGLKEIAQGQEFVGVAGIPNTFGSSKQAKESLNMLLGSLNELDPRAFQEARARLIPELSRFLPEDRVREIVDLDRAEENLRKLREAQEKLKRNEQATFDAARQGAETQADVSRDIARARREEAAGLLEEPQ